jgi:hypothetical protein
MKLKLQFEHMDLSEFPGGPWLYARTASMECTRLVYGKAGQVIRRVREWNLYLWIGGHCLHWRLRAYRR